MCVAARVSLAADFRASREASGDREGAGYRPCRRARNFGLAAGEPGRVLAVLAGAVTAWGAAAPPAAGATGVVPAAMAAVPAAVSWGNAIEVPGLAALNTGGQAIVNAVSCGSAGNCAAAGPYDDLSGGFVATEKNGRWGKAIAVPGLAALNTTNDAQVYSVSCGAAGSCAAGGYYLDRRTLPRRRVERSILHAGSRERPRSMASWPRPNRAGDEILEGECCLLPERLWELHVSSFDAERVGKAAFTEGTPRGPRSPPPAGRRSRSGYRAGSSQAGCRYDGSYALCFQIFFELALAVPVQRYRRGTFGDVEVYTVISVKCPSRTRVSTSRAGTPQPQPISTMSPFALALVAVHCDQCSADISVPPGSMIAIWEGRTSYFARRSLAKTVSPTVTL